MGRGWDGEWVVWGGGWDGEGLGHGGRGIQRYIVLCCQLSVHVGSSITNLPTLYI
jgi:hypothetical protein